MKNVRVIVGLFAVLLLLAGRVSAHVTVQPKEALVGYSVASVRVPNERDIPTTRVRIVVPQGVSVHGVMPVAGWQYELVREAPTQVADGADHEAEHAAEGRVTEIVWSGGRVNAGEFMEFPVSVQYEADIEKVSWKAYQTYSDGEIVAWDGSDEKYPASAVTILKESKVDSLAKSMGAGTPVTTAAQSSWMSVAAILVSVLALAVSMKKK